MTTTTSAAAGYTTTQRGRQMLNKVPEVTIYFWIIKVLCTTVGETASDYLAGNLNLGLTNTTFITGTLLIVTLVFQFGARRYLPAIYWLAVVLISVVGTQITDNLTDNAGVTLVTTTIVFRAGDLAAERLNLGYWVSALMFAGAIAAAAVAHYRFSLNAVAAFWIAYILTRPLGASLGDYLSQTRSSGGLGLGTTATSGLFLGAIATVVAYLSITRKDATETASVAAVAEPASQVLVVAHRTAATPALLDAVRERAARGRARFHLLVPNPAQSAEVTDAERHRRHTEGEHVLALALPLLDQAAGAPADGSVSIRHDPIDAIEETLHDGQFDEIILSTLPRSVSRWLHVDLPSRVAHLGLPVTTVIAAERGASGLAPSSA